MDVVANVSLTAYCWLITPIFKSFILPNNFIYLFKSISHEISFIGIIKSHNARVRQIGQKCIISNYKEKNMT